MDAHTVCLWWSETEVMWSVWWAALDLHYFERYGKNWHMYDMIMNVCVCVCRQWKRKIILVCSLEKEIYRSGGCSYLLSCRSLQFKRHTKHIFEWDIFIADWIFGETHLYQFQTHHTQTLAYQRIYPKKYKYWFHVYESLSIHIKKTIPKQNKLP